MVKAGCGHGVDMVEIGFRETDTVEVMVPRRVIPGSEDSFWRQGWRRRYGLADERRIIRNIKKGVSEEENGCEKLRGNRRSGESSCVDPRHLNQSLAKGVA